MKKIVLPVILALSMPVQAHDSRDIAAGIIGGIVVGSIIQQYVTPHMHPQPPVVVIPPPVVIYSPCYWVQEPIYDAWGRIVTYRQVRVCRTY